MLKFKSAVWALWVFNGRAWEVGMTGNNVGQLVRLAREMRRHGHRARVAWRYL